MNAEEARKRTEKAKLRLAEEQAEVEEDALEKRQKLVQAQKEWAQGTLWPEIQYKIESSVEKGLEEYVRVIYELVHTEEVCRLAVAAGFKVTTDFCKGSEFILSGWHVTFSW